MNNKGGVLNLFKKNKFRYIFSLIVTVFGLFSLFGGVSYAVLKGNVSSENEQIITTGSVKLKLTENFEDISKKIAIMDDTAGLTQDEVYEFTLSNIGSEPAMFDIKLVNEVPSNYTGSVVDEEYFKVGLEINGKEHGPFSLSEVEGIIESDIIYRREMINYKMRIWLDSEKADELSSMEDYKAFLKLSVEAQQRVDEMDSGKTVVLKHTGDYQEFVVPRDGWYYVELAGASGGPGHANGVEKNNYGLGAKTSGYIELTAGDKYYVYVGGQGGSANVKTCTNTTAAVQAGSGGTGGWNGGGAGGNDYCSASNTADDAAGGGGGATDIRLVSGAWNDKSSLVSRIMVAGGGAGGTYGYQSGGGGTLYGLDADMHNSNSSFVATKPSQTAGYAFGAGSAGAVCTSSNVGSGGNGGGYYGGTTTSCVNGEGGAGGSSYISGYAGVNSVENSTTITHTDQTLHYSGKYFIGGRMIENQNDGSGYAKFVYIDTAPERKSENLDSVRYVKSCTSYNSNNDHNDWVEIQAIKDGVNVAKGKTVTGTTAESSTYPYSRITDGKVDYTLYSIPSSYTTTQCVTVDLGSTYELDEVAAWHYFQYDRVYYDDMLYVSRDNSTWTTVTDEAGVVGSNGQRFNSYETIYNGYVQDGLILWYDGDKNQGGLRRGNASTWKNLASSSYTGNLNGATWGTNYLSFASADEEYVSINQINPTQLTMEVVYSKSSTVGTTSQMLLSNNQDGGYGILYNYEDGTMFGQYYIGGAYKKIYTTDKTTFNKVSTISSSYGSNKLKLYSGGLLVNSMATSGSFTDPTGSTYLMIGANPSGSAATDSYYDGKIYSVRLYNKVLTDEEVRHNYLYDKQRFNLE